MADTRGQVTFEWAGEESEARLPAKARREHRARVRDGGSGSPVARQAVSAAASCPTGPWLTALEAAGYLGLPSRKALYDAIRRGQVPVHHLGKRRMRFHRAELDQVLLSRR